MTNKRKFIASYDFLGSGFYFVLMARSREEAMRQYPNMDIDDEFPISFSSYQRSRIRENLKYDIDGPRIPDHRK